MHKRILLHCFFKSFLALQLARPLRDLSFEAERMFTRKKLVVCSQPSVQLQFTPRWEGRGESLPCTLCPVRSGGKNDTRKTPPSPQTITTISQTSDLALERARCSFVTWLLYGMFEKGNLSLSGLSIPCSSKKKGGGGLKIYIKLWSTIGELLREKKLFWNTSWRLMILFLCWFLQFCFQVIFLISSDFCYPQQIYLIFTWLINGQRSELAIQQFQEGKSPENTLILAPIATFPAKVSFRQEKTNAPRIGFKIPEQQKSMAAADPSLLSKLVSFDLSPRLPIAHTHAHTADTQDKLRIIQILISVLADGSISAAWVILCHPQQTDWTEMW